MIMNNKTILIKKSVISKIIKHAKDEIPIEACGYLAGSERYIKEIFPMNNLDKSPEHFSFDPKEQFNTVREARKKNLELLAVYHSHPTSPAKMSEEDKKLAYDPEMIYIIYSIIDNELKAFMLDSKKNIIDIEITGI